MTPSSEFISSLNNDTRAVCDSLADLGIRIWQPAGNYATTNDGLVHLIYVLHGILGCEPMPHLTRVLPREVLRVGGADERILQNPSRSETVTAVHLTLVPADNTPVSTRHHYFSDDQKDNKLCRIAACERDGRTLATRAPVDVYLTTLGRYDTVLLDRHEHQPLLILCPQGKATVNSEPISANDPAICVTASTATITGLQSSTVLIIRGQDTEAE